MQATPPTRFDLTHLRVHITVDVSGRLSELAVFNTRFYVRVRHLDEPVERCGVCSRSRSQLHMAHELAGALQQAGRIRQRRTVKEAYVDMRGEYIHIAEGRIAQTCNRTAIMQGLPDLVPASPHHLKPLTRDGSQITFMLFHPRIDGRVAFDNTVESQQFRFHRGSAFGSILRGTPMRGPKGMGTQKRPSRQQ
jgi:hypothetical protein